MSFVVASIAVAAVGAAKAVDGGIQANRAKKDAAKAQIELDKQKKAFEALDTSNPYLNMENTKEDLTVNTQEAEFAKQQSMQSQANIMQQFKGAAGGSGIAALAQTMANQGATDAQKASVSIGKQEQDNQKQQAAEASRIQGLEREGEIMSRSAEQGKIESLMGMSADEVAAANEARAAGKAQAWEGAGDIASGISGFEGGVDPTK
tara:strand:- start:1176 stop:1793 length:618 start_codon:yes stop_codon:yes gene_type:complete